MWLVICKAGSSVQKPRYGYGQYFFHNLERLDRKMNGFNIGLVLPSPHGLGAEWDEVVKQGLIGSILLFEEAEVWFEYWNGMRLDVFSGDNEFLRQVVKSTFIRRTIRLGRRISSGRVLTYALLRLGNWILEREPVPVAEC